VCVELGLQEQEPEKDAFEEPEKELLDKPLAETTNTEIIKISDSPPKKNSIEKVLEAAQKETLLNWRGLADEEDDMDKEPE